MSLNPAPSLTRRATLLDEPQYGPIADAAGHAFHQLVVGDGVEVAAQVGIDHLAVSSVDQPMHGADGIVGAALRSVGVLFAGQVGLEDGSQHDDRSHLHYPVSYGRYAQRSLFAVGFGNIYPTHGLRLIGLALELFRQSIQPRPKALRLNLVEGLAVHSGATAVSTAALPGVG